MEELQAFVVKFWVEELFTLIIAVFSFVIKSMHKKLKAVKAMADEEKRQREEENKAIKDGMRSLLRRQILIDCENAQGAGHCSARRKETINEMYTAYHGLGGNGVVSSAVRQVIDDLPITE